MVIGEFSITVRTKPSSATEKNNHGTVNSYKNFEFNAFYHFKIYSHLIILIIKKYVTSFASVFFILLLCKQRDSNNSIIKMLSRYFEKQ